MGADHPVVQMRHRLKHAVETLATVFRISRPSPSCRPLFAGGQFRSRCLCLLRVFFASPSSASFLRQEENIESDSTSTLSDESRQPHSVWEWQQQIAGTTHFTEGRSVALSCRPRRGRLKYPRIRTDRNKHERPRWLTSAGGSQTDNQSNPP
jgi:hypothetical protein